jgi:hypothetical protein
LRRRLLLGSHRSLRCDDGIMLRRKRKTKNEIAGFLLPEAQKTGRIKAPRLTKIDS